jgi:hypothetical protein
MSRRVVMTRRRRRRGVKQDYTDMCKSDRLQLTALSQICDKLEDNEGIRKKNNKMMDMIWICRVVSSSCHAPVG